jgi:uncharacterized membrane protein (UPF0127 family)
MMTLVNETTDHAIASDVLLATTRATRRRGLLGRDSMAAESALVLAPCCSIHTAFMRFAIDVLFVDGDGGVLRIVTRLVPWRLAIVPRAYAVIELAAGSLEAHPVAVGDRVYVRPGDGFKSASSLCASRSFRSIAAKPACSGS